MTAGQLMQRLRRADLVEGVGIHVGPASVAMAHLRKRLVRVSVEAAVVEPLPPVEQASLRWETLAAVVRDFVEGRRIDPRRAALVLPRGLAFFTRVHLPAATRDDLAQVLQYQLENLVPLPADQIHYEFMTKPHGDDRIEVLLMCLPRSVLEQHLGALAAGGVRPRVVTVTSLALADYVAFGRGEDASSAFVVREGDELDVAVVEGNQLVTSQVVPRRLLESPAALTQGVTRILEDHPPRTEERPCYVWHAGNVIAMEEALHEPELMAVARDRLESTNGFFEDASAAALPAVGGALAVVREATLDVNLLPAEQRRSTEDRLSLATLGLAGMIVLLFVVWGVSALVKSELQSRAVARELAALGPRIDEVRRLQDETDALRAQIEVLNSGQGVRLSDLIQHLTELVPDQAYLTTLTYRRGRVTMDGQAAAASDVVTALEKSRRFKEVSFSSPTTRAGDKERFALVAEVAR